MTRGKRMMSALTGSTEIGSTQLAEMVLEDELMARVISHSRSSDLDEICTYNLSSKDHVWTVDDQATVSDLLLGETDFMTSLPLPTTQPPPPDSPGMDQCSLGPFTSSISGPSGHSGQSALDYLSTHSLSWPWSWEDSFPANPSPTTTTSPFCDFLGEDFDLLAYADDNCMDTWGQLEVQVLTTAQQIREAEAEAEAEAQTPKDPNSHPSRSQTTITLDHHFRMSDSPGQQSLPSPLMAASGDLQVTISGGNDRHAWAPSGEYQRSNFLNRLCGEHISDSPASCEMSVRASGNGCKQLPGPDISSAASLEGSEPGFTRIKNRPSAASGQIGSPTEDQTFTNGESSPEGEYRDNRRNAAGKEPKRPKNGFIRYSVQRRAELSRVYPYKDNRAISKLLGTRWKKMTSEEKRPYEEEFSKDIHKIRTQNPLWRYAPAKRSIDELVEPMTTRLRPRDKIRSKFQDMNGEDWDWDLSTDSDCESSSADGNIWERAEGETSGSPVQGSATSWRQCDLCSLWRPLPGHVAVEDLPEAWKCSMNPDLRFGVCGRTAPLPVCVPVRLAASCRPTCLQPPEAEALAPASPVSPPASSLPPSGACGHPLVSSGVRVHLPTPAPLPATPLFIIYSPLPILYAPASSVVTPHAVLVNHYTGAAS